jgi:hypothetical protein
MAKMRLDPVTSQPTLPPISQQQLEDKAVNAGYQGDYTDTAAMISFINAQDLAQKVVANQPAANVGVTTPSTDTLAILGGTPQPAVTYPYAPTSQQQLEDKAVNAGYQGDLTDTAAMQSFINPNNQSVAPAVTNTTSDGSTSTPNFSTLQPQQNQNLDKFTPFSYTPDTSSQPAVTQQGNSFLEGEATNLGYQGDYTDTAAMQSFITPANQLARLVADKAAADKAAEDKADRLAADKAAADKAAADKAAADKAAVQGNSFLEREATNLGYQGDLTDTAAMISFIKAANQATANVGVTTPSADTLANLSGTGTVVEANKINTQGTGTAGTGTAGTGTAGTGTAGTGTAGTGTAGTGTAGTGTAGTGTAATSPPSTINTGSIPALTTADLTNWYNTQPKGITADQLKTALGEQQTALSGQNTEFLKNWNSSADALKNSILSGVDTKNQAFGTQATQGFMDAFKNFQIPTNQQTGVNLGNYNDNRNAAADQWWSQYVTGRR